MRIGHGYDVHKLVEGRKLILAGVEIPHEKGLLGHSDADVLTHALMDALLGACALGDIGHLFPDDDPAYKGANSLELLNEVAQLLNVTVVAQAPRIAPFVPAMRQNLSKALGLPLERVSVKATTEEHMGFTGRGEGISAHAVCLVEE